MLELVIRTERASYDVGEAVFLETNLRNTGSGTVAILKFFMVPADDPKKNNVSIDVYDASGTRLSRVSHVLTGRLLYHPNIQSLQPGETYREAFPLAGTFVLRRGRRRVRQALWCLGEDPEMTSASEYPAVTHGTFRTRVVYRVDEAQMMSLSEAERAPVWKGQLMSNTIEISMV